MFPWSKRSPKKGKPEPIDPADITPEYVATVTQELGISPYREALVAGGAACIRFKIGDERPVGSVAKGCRLGGSPDLPRDSVWPADPDEGTALPFALWLDLAALRAAYEIPELPATGALAIFADFEGLGGAVLFIEEPGAPRPAPSDVAVQFAPRELHPQRAISFPEILIDELGLSGSIGDELDPKIIPADPALQVGGFRCELNASRNPKEVDEDRFLLAQIPTNDDFGDDFGDGMVQVWISHEDLAARNFAEAEFHFHLI